MSAKSRSAACAAAGETVSRVRKPWIILGSQRCWTGTPAAARRAAYTSPSSRSGSCSAVTMMAGGKPAEVGGVQRADLGAWN